MKHWPDERALKLLGIEKPIIQAPMAGVDTPSLAAAVSASGGLGSLACTLLSTDQVREAWKAIRRETNKPVNLNFFCHQQKEQSVQQQEKWKNRLMPYYKELGLNADAIRPSAARSPFDESFCDIIEELKPEIVSFHFGLPAKALLQRVKKTGAKVLSSATTVEEAVWLEKNGCDAIIAQGNEAGGHRGMFLTTDLSTQIDTHALVPQIVSAVSVPVIAAGGIVDAKGIRTAFDLGASAVQLGTAYLFCPEAKVPFLYREALQSTQGDGTVITNIFSGRPARGILNRLIRELGPISSDAPDFPYASHFVNPLRTASEKSGSSDFMQMWSGQVRRPHEMSAGALTAKLSEEALVLFSAAN